MNLIPHVCQIKQLSQLVKPQLAIITNINAVHLSHFENEEGIADAKAEIFSGMSPDSQIVLNLDNKWGEFLISKARRAKIENIITFGKANACNVRICKIETTRTGSLVEIEILRKSTPEKINKIAIETSTELVKKLIGAEINSSSISAIVNDLSKRNGDKYYGS